MANGTATINATSGSVSGSATVTVEQETFAVTIQPGSLTLNALGDTATLTATVTDANGNVITSAQVAWASSDESVATVDASGLVTALADGTASVTATVGNVEASASVTVTQVAHSVSVEPTELAFSAIGDTATLTATVTDANGNAVTTAQVAWASSDESVATVDANGLVTSRGAGTALVTATAGAVEASANVTVSLAAHSISVEPTELAFSSLGDTASLTATVADANGNSIATAEVAWTSSDESVATVGSDGLVTAVAVGSATVTASSGGLQATAGITVTQVASSISVEPTELAFSSIGATATLTATVADANGNSIATAQVAWTSSDESVATVGSDGLVTAVAVGSATVTASSGGLQATVGITVTQVSSSISVEPTELAFSSIGDTASLTATVADANGNVIATAEVAWTSNDESVATVDSDGLVTAVAVGSATVTASSGGLQATAGVSVAQVAHSISVEPTELAFSSIGDTATLTATVADINGNTVATAEVVWTISDESVATVGSDGLVTAVAVGSATITASSAGLRATAGVSVTQVAHSISVEPTELAFSSIGDTASLTATVADANGNTVATAEVAWTSSDESVATVDSDGLVTAVAVGTATVTASSAGLQANANIVVAQIASSISVQPTELSFSALGDTASLSATVRDASGNVVEGVQVAWASSDSSVATVDANGLVTAVAVGTASVTAKVAELEASANVTVAQTAGSISVEPTELSFSALGDTASLSATVRDANDNVIVDAQVDWASGDTAVVTVDANGLVTAVADGTTMVTAAVGDLVASASVTVTQTIDSISIAPTELTFSSVGDTATLVATALDIHGNVIEGLSVSWTSADSTVATVDSDGLVSAAGPGTTTVTVSAGAASATAVVTVVQAPASILLEPDSLIIEALGDTTRASATVRDSNDNPIIGAPVAWASDDASVATVDSDGLVTAVAVGVALVTASSDTLAATVVVTVRQVPATILLNPDSVTFTSLRDTVTISASVRDARDNHIPDAVVAWYSEDSLVVSVDTTGLVTALERGSTLVKATSDSVSASVAVHVDVLSDREVLEHLYRTTGGDDWIEKENWMTDAPLEDWQGVTMLDDRVAELRLRANNLAGPFPEELTILNRLSVLDLSADPRSSSNHTQLHGNIAPSFGYLSRLRVLDLYGTGIGGQLPQELGQLSALRYLNFVNTELSGPIPETFANLTLDFFFFGNNLCLPPELEDWLSTIEGTEDNPNICVPPPPDRGILERFYQATGGPNWTDNTNWMTAAPLEDWHGVITDHNGRVVLLDLRDNNLVGHIPADFGQLDELRVLDLIENRLRDSIPSSFGELSKIEDILISFTEIGGQLPPELGNLTTLRSLHVSSTRLTGPIPETFRDLDLAQFYLDGSRLCVPSSLENWLTGIPQQASDGVVCAPRSADMAVLEKIFEATDGWNWQRSYNWISGGPLDTWYGVGVDENGRVTSLNLPYNDITGPLPPEVGDLEYLTHVFLFGNRLTGEIPAAIGQLRRLKNLSLSRNDFTGSIPTALGNLTALDSLYLNEAQLSGSIPAELGNLRGLRMLSLYTNQLSGPIPRELGALTQLEDLWLEENQLEGPLPPELGKMSSLTFLDLGQNQITGPIPSTLGDLRSLEILELQSNRLSGPIPPELGSLTRLTDLWLEENQLEGTLPPELGSLKALDDLDLAENQITGPIPSTFGGLQSLTRTELFDNRLSGPVPPELGNLTDVWLLDISNNELSGLLPRSFINLNSLDYFFFDSTDLCAQIDDEFQEWLNHAEQVRGTECDTGTVERFTLNHLYDHTGGDSWTTRTGWKSTQPLNDWHGVTLKNGRVSQLSLPTNGLRGPLAREMINLAGMELIDFGNNDLVGDIPDWVSDLSELSVLRIPNNTSLTGVLPFSLTSLTKLEVLDYSGTDLCASPSATFQDWLSDIDASGATCVNKDQVKLSVPSVYLVQAVQDIDGGVRLVAGRDALLRVFVTADQPRAFFEPEVRFTLMRGNQTVHTGTMSSNMDELATAVDESDLRFSYNARIPGEHIVRGISLVVDVDPDGVVPLAPGSVLRFPNSGAHPLDIVALPQMELTVVPVLEATTPDSSIFAWTNGISEDSPQTSLLRGALPISDFTAKTRATYITSGDLTSAAGQWNLILELWALRTAENGTGYYYGAASSKNGYVRGLALLSDPSTGFKGWVSMGKAWATELAHEVGHNLSLGHAPCGYPPPAPASLDPSFPYSNGSTGVWGYDFRDGSVVSPSYRRDIMGYCYDRGWISDYHFERAIDHRLIEDSEAAQAPMTSTGDLSDVLVLWGGAVDGELRLDPVFSMRTTPNIPQAAGAYRLEGTSVSGQTEFSLNFTPAEDKFGNKYFLFTIPIEPGWVNSLERITLSGPEGTITVDSQDPRSLSIVIDRGTGQIRALLRDWDAPLPAALGPSSGISVHSTRGMRDALRTRPPGGNPDMR